MATPTHRVPHRFHVGLLSCVSGWFSKCKEDRELVFRKVVMAGGAVHLQLHALLA